MNDKYIDDQAVSEFLSKCYEWKGDIYGPIARQNFDSIRDKLTVGQWKRIRDINHILNALLD